MNKFKFFDGQDNEWTGASWFWEGDTREGSLSINRQETGWNLFTMECPNGLRQFLQSFEENRIIPIFAMYHNGHWIHPPFNNGYNFTPLMLHEYVRILYYDIVINRIR